MMKTEIDKLLTTLEENETGSIILEPQSVFNGGIIGYDGSRLIYGYHETIEAMSEEFGSEEEALDWFSYNTLRSLPYMGDKAPIIWDSIDEVMVYPEAEEETKIECYLGLPNALQQVNYKENGE